MPGNGPMDLFALEHQIAWDCNRARDTGRLPDYRARQCRRQYNGVEVEDPYRCSRIWTRSDARWWKTRQDIESAARGFPHRAC